MKPRTSLENPRLKAGTGAVSSWTHHDWLLSWLQIAVCLVAGLPQAPLILAAAGIVVLMAAPVLARPFAYRRWWGWTLLMVCGLWWAQAALAGQQGSGMGELARIGGWCLVLLACLQILSLGRGGSKVSLAWAALGATWLFSRGTGLSAIALVVAQGVLSIESLRRAPGPSARRGSDLVRWIACAVVASSIVFAQHSWSRTHGSWGRPSWREPVGRVKGFSVVSRLGSFGPSYRPDRERKIAVRVWSPAAPPLLKGMVHDLYANGSWIATRNASFHAAERMSLDFSQICRDVSDTAAPVAWATSPDHQLPVLFVPAGTSCVGVVADSLKISATGIFHAPASGLDRGWTWYAAAAIDSATVPSDLRVPAELSGFLDSIWTEIDGLDAGSGSIRPDGQARTDRLARWFATRFRYDLDVPQKEGADPLRSFVGLRRGYCEYFASLSVLLLRRSGIPARYVTGFSGPQAILANRCWIYRQGDAHAWAEWRTSGKNWRTFDPTPPGTDSRVDRGPWSKLTESVGAWVEYAWHGLRDGSWRSRLDAADSWWNLSATGPWFAALAIVVVAGSWLGRSVFASRPDRGRSVELLRAQAILRRQGQVRRSDETVGAFLARLPRGANPKAREALVRYQRERWKRHNN